MRLGPKELRAITDGVVVTRDVERRLRGIAYKDIPETIWDTLNGVDTIIVMLLVGAVSIGGLADWWGFAPMLGMYTVLGVVWLSWRGLSKEPIRKRREQVEARFKELAIERQVKLTERERFYSSPEWQAIRKLVIKEEGRFCSECKKKIKRNVDITVDHKYPRSKYPELALQRENLRVLCRSCNATKGSDDWVESDDDNTVLLD